MDRIVSFFLILAITDLAKFIGGYARSFVIVNSIILFIMLAYLSLNIRILSKTLTKPISIFWTSILLIWPIATVIYHNIKISTAVVYPLYATACMLVCTILFLKRGAQFLKQTFSVSLFIVYFGVLLSLFAPQLFIPVISLQHDYSISIAQQFSFWGSRAFGFSMQPNAAALNIVLLMIGSILMEAYEKSARALIHVFIGLFFVMLTGSRGGMLLYAMFLVLYLFYFLKDTSTLQRLASRSTFKFRVKYVPLLCVIAIVPVGMYSLYAQINADSGRSIYDRWMKVFASDDEFSQTSDASLKARLEVRSAAVQVIMKAPILGQGLGAMEASVERGELPISTHNTLLKYAIAYGIPYVCLFIMGLLAFLRQPHRKIVNQYLQSNFFAQLVICILLASQIQSTLDRSLAMHSVIGLAIGLIIAVNWKRYSI
jgi:hypothetical protein